MSTGTIEAGELTATGIAERIEEDICFRVGQLAASGVTPHLGIISDNYEPGTPTRTYIDMKTKKGAKLGIEVTKHIGERPSEVAALIETLNEDPHVHAHITQLPFKKLEHASKEGRRFVTDLLLSQIVDYKDADGLRSTKYYEPATPKAIVSILDHNRVAYTGDTHVLLRGNGRLVNLPLGPMLRERGTRNLEVIDIDTPADRRNQLLDWADLIITAAGSQEHFTPDHFPTKRPRTFVDAGTAEQAGKVVGDVSEDLRNDVQESGGRVTAKKGGVGPLTVLYLLGNVTAAAELQLVESTTPYRRPTPGWIDQPWSHLFPGPRGTHE